MGNALKSLILTNEYPPNVYGGAGVHVEYLTRELAQLIDVDVRTFGEQDVDLRARLRVRRLPASPHDLSASGRSTCGPCSAPSAATIGFVAEPVDAPTSSTATPGTRTSAAILAKLAYGIPLV